MKQIIAEKGGFPTQSQVGVMAMREFDDDTDAGKLVSLLSDFDGLFNG